MSGDIQRQETRIELQSFFHRVGFRYYNDLSQEDEEKILALFKKRMECKVLKKEAAKYLYFYHLKFSPYSPSDETNQEAKLFYAKIAISNDDINIYPYLDNYTFFCLFKLIQNKIREKPFLFKLNFHNFMALLDTEIIISFIESLENAQKIRDSTKEVAEDFSIEKAILYLKKGEEEKSEDELKKAIQNKRFEAYKYLINLYETKGKKKALTEILEEGMRNMDAYALYKCYELAVKDSNVNEESLIALKKAAELEQSDAIIKYVEYLLNTDLSDLKSFYVKCKNKELVLRTIKTHINFESSRMLKIIDRLLVI